MILLRLCRDDPRQISSASSKIHMINAGLRHLPPMLLIVATILVFHAPCYAEPTCENHGVRFRCTHCYNGGECPVCPVCPTCTPPWYMVPLIMVSNAWSWAKTFLMWKGLHGTVVENTNFIAFILGVLIGQGGWLGYVAQIGLKVLRGDWTPLLQSHHARPSFTHAQWTLQNDDVQVPAQYQTMAQPAVAQGDVVRSRADLERLKVDNLKGLAKQHGVPYNTRTQKVALIDAIAAKLGLS